MKDVKDIIRRVPGGWQLFSRKGKKLSPVYKTREEAERREKQVEYFKHKRPKKR